jgi:uncharacterized YigZ family protein
MEYFYTVDTERKHEIKIKRSVFIAHLHFAENIAEAKKFIAKINKEHKNANHNCWAFIVGERGEIFHSSDAGEPAGTAGKPILNTLKKHKATNIVAVVTRYFGGVKLGIRGLTEAYSRVTEETIALYPLKKIVKIKTFTIETTYDFFASLKYQIKSSGGEITEIEYSDKIRFIAVVEEAKRNKVNQFLQKLAESGKIVLL